MAVAVVVVVGGGRPGGVNQTEIVILFKLIESVI